MKYWIVKLLVVSLLFCGYNGLSQSEEEKVKGKVKSLRSIPYEVFDKFGEIKKGDIVDGNLSIKYNKRGNKTIQ